jgi:lipopolysaccharide export LptBFGC system permease protein LptF
MHLYRQTIVLFGIIIPIALAAVVVGFCFLLKSNVVASYENKLKSYKAYEISRLSSLEIEAKVTKDRQHLERWNNQLSQETASAVTTNLREISEHLPTKEIQQTAFERPNGNGGFGNASAQASSQIRIAFRGTFRTMQRAFLELETRMPQLQLQDLKIDPSSSGSTLLNFQVTYNAWEN